MPQNHTAYQSTVTHHSHTDNSKDININPLTPTVAIWVQL